MESAKKNYNNYQRYKQQTILYKEQINILVETMKTINKINKDLNRENENLRVMVRKFNSTVKV
jgi:hypothetical protein